MTVAGPPGRAGKPANFEKMQPKSIEESGIRGIASCHGYEVLRVEQSLFHLQDDPGETRNIAEQHPDVVRRIEALAEQIRAAVVELKETVLQPKDAEAQKTR